MRRILFVPAIAAAIFSFSLPTIHTASAATGTPVELPGYVPTVVATGKATQEGAVPASQQIDFAVTLRIKDEPGLQAAIAASGGRALPDSVTSQYLPSASDEQQVVAWLQGLGFTVNGTYPNHVLVDASGTASQVQSAFKVALRQYRGRAMGKVQDFYAPANNPTISSTMTGLVGSITGLDSLPRVSMATNGNTDGQAPYYPQDFANAYDVNPLWNAGATGTGQHIGITLWTVPPSDTTLQKFATTTGAQARTRTNGKLRVVLVDGGTTQAESPDDGEAGMDIEYSGSMAPGAIVDYYEAHTDSQGNPTDKSLEDALNMAGTDVANNQQITNSWGECEPSSKSDPFLAATETILAANSAKGHTYFFSSGDSGSFCATNSDGTGIDPFPEYPTDSAYAVSVGGTAFSNPVGATWPGETSWAYCDASCSGGPEGSSGGYSALFNAPVWQAASGFSGTMRGFPDISAVADPATGAEVCYGSSGYCDQFGGTSLSSPIWAGILADVNSYLAIQGKPSLGFLAPTLYSLANSNPQFAPFHDITTGTNGNFNAGAGWDAVTGLGTPDVWNLAQDLGGSPSVTPPTTGQLVLNGGFENGGAPWASTSNGGRTLITSTLPHTGTASAQLCGAASCADQVGQTVSVSNNYSSAILTYWYYSTTAKRTGSPCTDKLMPEVLTTTGQIIGSYPLATYCNTYPTNRWVQGTVNLTTRLAAYKGKQIQLVFRSTSGTGAATTFYVDDVSLLTK